MATDVKKSKQWRAYSSHVIGGTKNERLTSGHALQDIGHIIRQGTGFGSRRREGAHQAPATIANVALCNKECVQFYIHPALGALNHAIYQKFDITVLARAADYRHNFHAIFSAILTITLAKKDCISQRLLWNNAVPEIVVLQTLNP